MMYLNDIAKQALILAQNRKLDTNVLPTLKHCAGEVLEATEAYTVLNRTNAPIYKEDVGLELADIIICALTASAKLELDIEEYIGKAMQKNAQRAYQEISDETA